jgi:MoaA/NifB/PqqE/SkfB family radical SAM enzyme
MPILKLQIKQPVSVKAFKTGSVNRIIFDLKLRDLGKTSTGKKITAYLHALKRKKIKIRSLNPLPLCTFNAQGKKYAQNLRLTDGCLQCPLLFRVTYFNKVVFCSGRQGRFIDEYQDKLDLYKHFQAAHAQHKKPLICQGCSEEKGCSYGCIFRKKNFLIHGYANNYRKTYLFPSPRRFFPDYYLRNLAEADKRLFRPHKIFCYANFNCSNDCLYCFHGDKNKLKNPSFSFLKEMILEGSKDFPVISFCGGEPTINSNILDLVRFSKECGLYVHMFSNGRRFSDKAFAEELVSAGVDRITEVFHSHIPKLHDAITQRPGSFRQMLEGIDNLHRLGFDTIHTLVTVHKQNYRSLKELTGFLLSLKPNAISFDALVLEGQALKNFQQLAVRLSDSAPFLEEAFDLLIRKNLTFAVRSFPLCIFKEKYRRYFVNDRYSLLLCNFAFKKNSKKWLIKTNGLNLGIKCVDCQIKKNCPGTWGVYYCFFGEDELLPQKSKTRSGTFIQRTRALEVAGIPLKLESRQAELLSGNYKKFICRGEKTISQAWDLEVIAVDKRDNKKVAKRLKPFGALTKAAWPGIINLLKNGKHKVKYFYPLKNKASDMQILAFSYSQILASDSGALFHAAAVVKDRKAYLFFGSSGAGKTTVAALSRSYKVLGDDVVAVIKNNGAFRVFSTPWNRKDFIYPESGFSAPLAAIFFLEKGERINFTPLTAQDALARVIFYHTHFLFYTEKPLIKNIFSTCHRIAERIPAYKMEFSREKDFWPELEGALKE